MCNLIIILIVLAILIPLMIQSFSNTSQWYDKMNETTRNLRDVEADMRQTRLRLDQMIAFHAAIKNVKTIDEYCDLRRKYNQEGKE